MKKCLIVVALISLLSGLRAQSDSTQASSINQVDTIYEDEGFSATNRNPIYTFGSPFCEHFAELKFFLGTTDMGMGINYTYLPEVWGGHVSGDIGFDSKWLLAGADYRLSKPWNLSDFHVYGGLGFRYGDNNKVAFPTDEENLCMRPAMEVGVRWASDDGLGRFCMTSGTIGILTDFVNTYVTIGFSSSLALLASVFLLLGFAN